MDAVSEILNQSDVGRSRTGTKHSYNLHVSDIIATSGPRAFCARQHVLLTFTERNKNAQRLSPARKMLFATGHFLHDYVVTEFLARSPYAKYAYGDWSCRDADVTNIERHDIVTDSFDNVINRKCKCGLPLTRYNEIELKLPNLVGHPDLVFLVDGIYYIWEFKSYDRSDISFDELNMALPDHRLQVSCYYKMLKVKAAKEGRKVSKRIAVMYIDRSNSKLFGGQPFKTFATTVYDDKYLDPIYNSVKHYQRGIRDGVLPDRICGDIKDRRSRDCQCAVECFYRRSKRVGPGKSTNSNKVIKTKVRNRD